MRLTHVNLSCKGANTHSSSNHNTCQSSSHEADTMYITVASDFTSFLPIIPISSMATTSTHEIHPAKRRKIKRNDPMHETDVKAQDVATVERVTIQTRKGPVEKKILVPIPQATTLSEDQNTTLPNMNTDENDLYNNPDYGNDEMNGEAAEPAAT